MTKDEFITVFFGKLRDDEEFAERFHLENATFAKKMEIAEAWADLLEECYRDGSLKELPWDESYEGESN